VRLLRDDQASHLWQLTVPKRPPRCSKIVAIGLKPKTQCDESVGSCEEGAHRHCRFHRPAEVDPRNAGGGRESAWRFLRRHDRRRVGETVEQLDLRSGIRDWGDEEAGRCKFRPDYLLNAGCKKLDVRVAATPRGRRPVRRRSLGRRRIAGRVQGQVARRATHRLPVRIVAHVARE
jgi:hypothetical protein